jgi:two-component system CheB/CheR fusion protein
MEYVKKTLIPKILSSKQGVDPVRVWVPACSTGEEAYSLAIVFKEVLEDKGLTTPVQIFATDLSDICIAKARLGLYSASDLSDVSPGRIKRFFEKIDGGHRVVKEIRDLCIFASHNIFKDPPFSRLDLISCCNLMIYLDSFLQKKIVSIFHYSLINNGYLVLENRKRSVAHHICLRKSRRNTKYLPGKKTLQTRRSLICIFGFERLNQFG